jgi:hypothetical protein
VCAPTQNVIIPTQNVIIPTQNVIIPTQNVIIPTQNVIMPGFQCEKCLKFFKLSSHLRRHNKIVQCCQNPLECPKCGKELSTRQSKNIHVKHCEGPSTALIPVPTTQLEGVGADPTKTIPFSKSILQINNQNQIQNNIDNLNQTNNVTNNNNNIVNNITINNYSQENLEYVTNAVLDRMLKLLPVRSVPDLIEYIHFNKEHPENHNIRPKSSKRKVLSVMHNCEWKTKPQGSVIDNLIETHRRVLQMRCLDPEYKASIDKETYELICSEVNKFSKVLTPDSYKKVFNEVQVFIEDMTKVV